MNRTSRIYNSIKNVSYGLVVTVVNTVTSFITRTVLIRFLGVEAVGLNGLFTEVIAMMSLAELGIGMAIVYSLYKPLQEKDHKRISQLMNLYRTAYNRVALCVFCIGLVLMPIIHLFISDVNYEINYIRGLFVLYVINTAGSYLFSYKTSLLNADQKQYVVSVVNAGSKVLFTILSAILIALTRNYVLYVAALIVYTFTTNIIISRYVDKTYNFIDYSQKLEKEEKRVILINLKNIFVKRVSGIITSSTDNVLISVLVSTVQVGFYSNYVMVFSLVRMLKTQFTNGITASIGNLSVTEDANKCISVLRNLTYLYFCFGLIMTMGLVAVSDVFISIWLGSSFVMDSTIIYCAIFNLFIEICCEPLWRFLEVSGLFKKDKNIAILGSGINLIVSIVLGRRIGILGIFIGTVCTQIIQMVLKILLIFKDKYMISPRDYYLMWGKLIVSFVISSLLVIRIKNNILNDNLYLDFLIKGMLSVAVSIAVCMGAFCRSKEFIYTKNLISKIIRHRS